MRSGRGAQRKGLAGAHAPSLHGHEGLRPDGAMRGGGWLSPLPLSAKQLVPLTTRDPAHHLSPGRGAGGIIEHPCCLQRCASLVSSSSAQLAHALPGLVLPHPCCRGAGVKHCPSFREGRKGGKTFLSPQAPWGWQRPELSCREGVSLRTGVQWGQPTPAWGGGPAPWLAAAPSALQGSEAWAPAGTPAQSRGVAGSPSAPVVLQH